MVLEEELQRRLPNPYGIERGLSRGESADLCVGAYVCGFWLTEQAVRRFEIAVGEEIGIEAETFAKDAAKMAALQEMQRRPLPGRGGHREAHAKGAWNGG